MSQHAYFDSVDPTVYLFSDGRTFENKDPWDAVMRCQITHLGTRAYLSAIASRDETHAVTKEGWSDIMRQLGERGVRVAEYHHNHKLITADIVTGKTHCERCAYTDDEDDEITYDDFKPKCRFCRSGDE